MAPCGSYKRTSTCRRTRHSAARTEGRPLEITKGLLDELLRVRRPRRLLCLAACCLMGLLGACQRNIQPPRTVPVRGVVKYKGKPAAGIRVKFHPQFELGSIKFIPLGETRADGGFTLSTGAARNGAPRGSYIVTFEKPEIAPAHKTNYIETEIDAFQGKYSDPQKSKLRVTIERGENSLQPFELE